MGHLPGMLFWVVVQSLRLTELSSWLSFVFYHSFVAGLSYHIYIHFYLHTWTLLKQDDDTRVHDDDGTCVHNDDDTCVHDDDDTRVHDDDDTRVHDDDDTRVHDDDDDTWTQDDAPYVSLFWW